VQGGIERVGDVEVLAFLAQVRRAQPQRKQHALELDDDGRQRLARREFDAPYFAVRPVRLAPLLARVVQFAHDVLDVEIGHRILLVVVVARG
jgi:hypothetical protein